MTTQAEASKALSLAKSQAGDPGQNGNEMGGKFLTFYIGEEEYGLEILSVHEIIGIMDVTAVPRTPRHILGVINLRGKIIPILELRLKFGLPSIDNTEETCIIVVQCSGVQMGIVVDKVSEVLDIPSEEIEDAPSFGESVNTDYILGIGKSDDNVKLLLDIDKIISSKDMELIEDIADDSLIKLRTAETKTGSDQIEAESDSASETTEEPEEAEEEVAAT
ncbi:MAG: purine-binding chemotaxis protein CheW [candidate division Zixibacteria bacterium]|nr:purine-binding chemotaxis protein CheW [candidate division Zixibacteria bacterium]